MRYFGEDDVRSLPLLEIGDLFAQSLNTLVDMADAPQKVGRTNYADRYYVEMIVIEQDAHNGNRIGKLMFVVQFFEILVLQQYDVASFAGIFDIFPE